jgi:hypothetical protein
MLGVLLVARAQKLCWNPADSIRGSMCSGTLGEVRVLACRDHSASTPRV